MDLVGKQTVFAGQTINHYSLTHKIFVNNNPPKKTFQSDTCIILDPTKIMQTLLQTLKKEDISSLGIQQDNNSIRQGHIFKPM